jgi:hypothetical protein
VSATHQAFLAALFAVILIDGDAHAIDEATGEPTLRSLSYLVDSPDGPQLVVT